MNILIDLKTNHYLYIGKFYLNIPQIKSADSPFYPSLLKKGSRID